MSQHTRRRLFWGVVVALLLLFALVRPLFSFDCDVIDGWMWWLSACIYFA